MPRFAPSVLTAIVRSPDKLAGHKAELVSGTPYDYETLERAMEGCDAVVSVPNVSRKSDNFWAPSTSPPDLISRSRAHALRAMAKHGIERFVALGTVGAGSSWQGMPLFLKPIVRYSTVRYAFDDRSEQERLLAASEAAYTVARAPMLRDEPSGTGVLVSRPGERTGRFIDRQSVAELFVSILESGEHPQEIIHVSSRLQPLPGAWPETATRIGPSALASERCRSGAHLTRCHPVPTWRARRWGMARTSTYRNIMGQTEV